jgi:glycine cleavage system H protein
MPETTKPRKSGSFLKVARFSRRQFFERIGVTLGGAALGSLALASACKQETKETMPASTQPLPTTQPLSSAPETTNNLPSETQTTTAAATTTQSTSLLYVVDSAPPAIIPVPNSSCNIATDRLYSLEHIWVKQYGPDLVAIGITPSLIAILYEPYKVDLLDVGTVLAREGSFGTVTGYKTVADLTMPVSGTIIQRNESLTHGVMGAYLTMLNAEPFHHGWLVALKLSKPDELKDLMSPDDYLRRLKADLAPH